MKLKQKIDLFINNWNNKFPIDLWWRKRYGVSFGSEKHRAMTHLQMYIDYIEEQKLNTLIKEREENQINDEFEDNTKGEVVKMTKKEIDEEFDNLDLTKY